MSAQPPTLTSPIFQHLLQAFEQLKREVDSTLTTQLGDMARLQEQRTRCITFLFHASEIGTYPVIKQELVSNYRLISIVVILTMLSLWKVFSR